MDPSASKLVALDAAKQKRLKRTTPTDAADTYYTFNVDKLEALRKKTPWKNDPKWFNRVAVSPSAIMKMMTHCHSGVEKGLKKGSNPIEVMGLLLGRPNPSSPKTLIVTDVFPLPIEGFETRVIADDEDVVNHMIALGESLENTRREKFMGWYHSHPFDVGLHSHCFLSQTDISTQLQWQRAEDPHGNPFLAVVVDPLRSLAKKNPELKAFRAYPPEYNSPIPNECPDGSVILKERTRLEKWGSCWSRYYELEMEYFMSKNARHVMNILTHNFLWMRNLGNTPSLESDTRLRYPERVQTVAEKITNLDLPNIASTGSASSNTRQSGAIDGGGGGGGRSSSTDLVVAQGAAMGSSLRRTTDKEEISKACQGVVELAVEKVHTNIMHTAKKQLFS